jgi:hypothetical protein
MTVVVCRNKAHQAGHDEHDPAEITRPVPITRLQRRELIQSTPQGGQHDFFSDLLVLLKLDAWQITLLVCVSLCALQQKWIRYGRF